MNTDMQRRALAARDAHLALLDLKKLVDEAAQTTHSAELEAIHLAVTSRPEGDISSKLGAALDRLGSADFEAFVERARNSLQTAMS